jgi:hypothetical protein
MKLISALVGLTALGGIALATAPASAMPIAVPGQVSQASNVEQVNYVCNEWGHCWHQHYYRGGTYQPSYYGGWHHWHPRYYGGWGYGGWHHWHPQYYGGWGYGGWHHWHHWHAWNQW